MPRESIVNAQSRDVQRESLDGKTGETVTIKELGFSVGWNKAGWVQVHMFPPEWETTGDWHIVDLDRAACNRLIRMTRKARDAAYGSDA